MTLTALLGIAVLLALIGFAIIGVGLLIARWNSDETNNGSDDST